MKNIVCLQNRGGYDLYGLEITNILQDVFPELRTAYVCFYASGMDKAIEYANVHYTKEITGNSVERDEIHFDAGDILLEFTNGKKVKISNSEWGWIEWK